MQSENGCRFVVPSHSMPKPFAIPAHDFERADRPLVPVFNLSQDRHDILGHPTRAQAGVGNRNHGGRDLVGKISSGSRRFRELGIESDFVTHLWTEAGIARFRMIVASRVTPGIGPLNILMVRAGKGQKGMLGLGGGL